VRFIGVRGELFRSVYLHRTVRAIDLTLADLFRDSRQRLFPASPLENLAAYRQLTDWSLLVDTERWAESEDAELAALGARWVALTRRQIPWKLAAQRHVVFGADDAERSSVFSSPDLLERALRQQLDPAVADVPLRVDLARHVHRPHTRGPTAGLNFLFVPSQGIRPLSFDQLFRHLPVSLRTCRVYVQDLTHAAVLSEAMDRLAGPGGADDVTNM
jgi:hypothetical protein